MRLQRIVILLVVLGLIVGLEVMLMSRCSRQENTPAPTREPIATSEPVRETIAPAATDNPTFTTGPVGFTSPPMPSNTPVQVTNPPAPTVQPTRQPTPTPAPTATPTPPPTDPPEQAPGTVHTVTASGSFSSNTGTALNMGVSWQAVDQGDGTTTITVSGTANSYSLNVSGKGVSINFGGYSTSVTSNAVNVTSSTPVQNSIFSTSLNVPTGTAGTMTVTWNYNGAYGDTSLPTITASDYVYTN